MSFEMSVLALAWVAILILALAMAGLLRQVHELRENALHEPANLGPPEGHQAPRLDEVVWGPVPTVLLFLQDDCETCRSLAPAINTKLADESGVRLLTLFPGASNGMVRNGVPRLENQQAAFDRYQVRVAPFAVAVSSDGRVAATQPIGSLEIFENFLSKASAWRSA